MNSPGAALHGGGEAVCAVPRVLGTRLPIRLLAVHALCVLAHACTRCTTALWRWCCDTVLPLLFMGVTPSGCASVDLEFEYEILYADDFLFFEILEILIFLFKKTSKRF